MGNPGVKNGAWRWLAREKERVNKGRILLTESTSYSIVGDNM